MKKISSSQNVRLKKAIALYSSRGRKKQSRFVVHGTREIRRLLAKQLAIDELFVCSEIAMPNLEWLPPELKEHRLFDLPQALFEKLTYGDREDPLVAIVQRPERQLEQFPWRPSGFYLVVDQIEKPGNLGAIFRSADGAACDGILISDPLTDPFHPNAIRSSMGTVFSVPFAIATATDILSELQNQALPVWSAVIGASMLYSEVNFSAGAAVVLGNEARGVGATWLAQNGIRLPMLGISDSLNVSVTAGILAFENWRQRSADLH